MGFICKCFCLILIQTLISCTIEAPNKIHNDSVDDQKTSKGSNLLSIKYDKQSNKILSRNEQSIGGTNVTTGVYYCIQDTNGQFLRWDGNVGSSRFGLVMDSVDRCEANSYYKFIIEIDKNNVTRIKNKATDTYLVYYYSNDYYFLSNSSSYTNGVNIVIRNNGYFNIRSTYSSTVSYYLTNRITFVSSYGIYVSNAYSSDNYNSWRFVRAQNQSPVDSDLKLRVFSFNYEEPDQNKIDNYLNVFDVISPTVINNTSPAKITHEISRDEVITEVLKWRFDQNLDFFNVTIVRSLPRIVRRKTELKRMGANFGINSLTNVNKDNYFSYEREYSIRKTIDIPPQTSVSIEATLSVVEQIPIKFSSMGEITARPPKSGNEIASIVQNNTELEIAKILDNSVIVELNGELIATFPVNDDFVVTSFDII